MSKELTYRFDRTIAFLEKQNLDKKMKILDLGTPNSLSKRMELEGYNVVNSGKTDLDLNPEIVKKFDVEVVTAFEILEHLVSPFNVLRELPANKLFATVPLRLWFSKAYRNLNNEWDQHYHEFEDWQFDWLVQKSGWKIIDKEKWIMPSCAIGFRPILRRFTPRIYAIYAER